ncbi:TPA: GNAT family N-acetyltransferase [Enterococcus faecium]
MVWKQRNAKNCEKCGMTKEGAIRKVRFLNNQYYDSVKYGILREELAD